MEPADAGSECGNTETPTTGKSNDHGEENPILGGGDSGKRDNGNRDFGNRDFGDAEAGHLQELISQIGSAWPPQRFRDVGVVVGLSGGADSTALLIALGKLADTPSPKPTGFLVAAHFNHGLRGQESDADQQFSADLAQQLGIRFATARSMSHSTSQSTAQSTKPCSDEATMSAQRMQFLTETAKQHGARYVALAHSLEDNVETVLHHLMRGTGPAGLCGIGSPRSVDDDLVLVRPMLEISRDKIRAALQSIGQTWREDSSNAATHYSRNWIRHELLPLNQTLYPAAIPAIDRAIQ